MDDLSYKSSLIDIIIPIYNGSKYLNDLYQNISWIFEREFNKLINVILVDDGSTDNTSTILKDLTKLKHENLKILTQKNQGEGPARNTGIKNSSSPYILFLDCDDKLLREGINGFLKEYKKLEDFDIYLGSYFINFFNNNLKKCKNCNRIIKGNLIPANFFNRKLYYGIGNTIISRKILEEKDLWFKNFETGSDNNFFRSFSLYAKNLVSTSNYFFVYQKNQVSVMNSSATKYMDVIESIEDTRLLLKKSTKYDNKTVAVLNKALNYSLLQEVLGIQWRSILNKNKTLQNQSLKLIDDFPLKINLFDFLGKVKLLRRLILLVFNFFPMFILSILNSKFKKVIR